jgi:conjugative relaxase-like TrwC/TraI family protein
MLRVTTIHASSASASAAYYTRYLTGAPGEVPGVWTGHQAAGFGLSGTVETAPLERLLSGCHPMSGTQLGYPLKDRKVADGRVVKAVAGFDATFSAPKSLSVLWALTGDRRYLEAHDVAVSVALAHLERFGSTTRIRYNDKRRHPDTNGLTIAVFRQMTSRADDPQIDTHAVISAKVQTEGSVVRARWPLPETASADARRPVSVGTAQRIDPPLRRRLGADRQGPSRDRRRPRRAP